MASGKQTADSNAVAKGDSHTVALCGDGKVVAWGDNTYGQTNVPAGLSDVVAVAAGLAHSLAQLTNGTVTGWGDSDALQIPAHLTNAVAIAADTPQPGPAASGGVGLASFSGAGDWAWTGTGHGSTVLQFA